MLRFFHEYTSERTVAGSSCTLTHRVGEGEYELDFITLMPQGVDNPVRTEALFVMLPSSITVTQDIVGGFATEIIPLTVKGPIPFRGPGYFMFQFIAQSATNTDTLQVQFSYRKVMK